MFAFLVYVFANFLLGVPAVGVGLVIRFPLVAAGVSRRCDGGGMIAHTSVTPGPVRRKLPIARRRGPAASTPSATETEPLVKGYKTTTAEWQRGPRENRQLFKKQTQRKIGDGC